MGQLNVHSFRPTSVGGLLCLVLSYVPPLIAVALMMLIIVPYYKLYVIGVLWKLVTFEAVEGWGWFLFCVGGSSFGFGCLFVSFWRCLFTPPGYVGDAWKDAPALRGAGNSCSAPPAPVSPCQTTSSITISTRTKSSQVGGGCGAPQPLTVSQLGRGGALRYCSACSLYKPDDAHHCHDCGRCIERMDHHCPWINNCVGRDTEKFFVLFLCYIAFTGGFIATTLAGGVGSGGVDVLTSVLLVMVLIGAGVFGVMMGGFAAFHVFMMLRGMTTIDFVIARRTGQSIAASVLKRQLVLNSVFGMDRRWWQCILPTAPKRASDANGDAADAALHRTTGHETGPLLV